MWADSRPKVNLNRALTGSCKALQKFIAQLPIPFRARRMRGVAQHRQSVAGRFGDSDIAFDDAGKKMFAKMPLQFV